MIPHLNSAKSLRLFALNVQIQHSLRKRRVEFGRLTIGLSLLIFLSILGLHVMFDTAASASNLQLTTASFSQSATLLAPGEAVERELSGDAVHQYRFSLPAGHFLRLTIEQKGVDVIAVLFLANGEKVMVADYAGKQSLPVIAANSEAQAIYRVEIRSRLSGQSGRYLVRIEDQRPATPRDADRVNAERLVAEAMEAGRQNGQAGLRLAVEKYRLSLPLWRSFPVQRDDQSAEARTFYLMALRQQDLGEHQPALESYLQALELSRSIQDEEREHLALSALGTLYFELGDKRKAIDCYNSALNYSRSRSDRSNEAVALVNLGVAYKSLGENAKAMEQYQQALAVAQALGDRELQAAALTNLARLHDLTGERVAALKHYQQSLPLWRALGNAGGEAVTLKNMGALAEAAGQAEEALEHFRQALSLCQTTGDVTREAHIRGDLARVERNLGNFVGSRSEIEKALAIFDSQRQQVFNPDLRASFTATNQRYYEFYIDLLMRQQDQKSAAKLSDKPGASSENYLAKAFQVSEQSKARALADLISEARIDLREGVPAALLDRENDLAQRLTIKKAERAALTRKKAPTAEIETVTRENVNLNLELEQIQNEIKRANPHYASLVRPTPVELAEVQSRLLDEDSVLLEFALGEERSYVWAVGKTSVQSAVLPSRAEIEEQALRFYELLTARSQTVKFEKPAQKRQRIQQADRDLNQAATSLSCTLLKPVAEMLSQKRLLVVGDGILNYIPFGALPEPVAGDRLSVVGKATAKNRPPTADHQPPLLVKHEIINLPSATVLAELRRDPQSRRQSTADLAIVADPVFNRTDDRISLSQSHSNNVLAANKPVNHSSIPASQSLASSLENVLRNVSERDAGELTRLPFSRQEAVKIASLAAENKRLLALDFQASRALVVADALRPYRYIHFATHGLLNSQSPELSGLVLSLVNDQGQSQLGVLRLGDIYNLKLSADLVVLSACRTGLGKEVRGEGVMGLTRGFMHAGVPRVIASLWSVDDAATSELMTRFYRELLTGKQSPAAALRAAQVSMWKGKQWPSPYYWAAFTLQGEPK